MRNRIGISCGTKNTVDLYCEIQSVKDQIWHCHVINGQWAFTFDVKNNVVKFTSPTGQHCHYNWRVVFDAPLPKSMNPSDYNLVMDYMEQQIRKPKLIQRLDVTAIELNSFVSNYQNKFRRSCAAFVRAWRGDKPNVWDDDIPF